MISGKESISQLKSMAIIKWQTGQYHPVVHLPEDYEIRDFTTGNYGPSEFEFDIGRYDDTNGDGVADTWVGRQQYSGIVIHTSSNVKIHNNISWARNQVDYAFVETGGTSPTIEWTNNLGDSNSNLNNSRVTTSGVIGQNQTINFLDVQVLQPHLLNQIQLLTLISFMDMKIMI